MSLLAKAKIKQMQKTLNKIGKSYRTEREFGIIVGAVLVLIGSWWMYRRNWLTGATGLIVIGTLLIVLGFLLPRVLVISNRIWMSLALALSMVTTPIILGIIFYAIFLPIGFIKRLTGWDPLRRRAPEAESYWVDYNERHRDTRHFEKMY